MFDGVVVPSRLEAIVNRKVLLVPAIPIPIPGVPLLVPAVPNRARNTPGPGASVLPSYAESPTRVPSSDTPTNMNRFALLSRKVSAPPPLGAAASVARTLLLASTRLSDCTFIALKVPEPAGPTGPCGPVSPAGPGGPGTFQVSAVWFLPHLGLITSAPVALTHPWITCAEARLGANAIAIIAAKAIELHMQIARFPWRRLST